MTVVVADSSPLNYLTLIGSVDVLYRLYGTVVVPQQVIAELVDPAAPYEVRRWASSLPDWVDVRVTVVSDGDMTHLDPGERAAIVLAESEPGVLVAQRGAPLIASPTESLAHADGCPLGFHVVVELIDTCQDGLDETSVSCVVDALGYGPESHARTGKQSPHGVLIRGVPGEARQRVHDQVPNLAPALLAESEEPKELSTLRRLRGLAAIHEDLGNPQIVVVAVLATMLLLNL